MFFVKQYNVFSASSGTAVTIPARVNRKAGGARVDEFRTLDAVLSELNAFVEAGRAPATAGQPPATSASCFVTLTADASPSEPWISLSTYAAQENPVEPITGDDDAALNDPDTVADLFAYKEAQDELARTETEAHSDESTPDVLASETTENRRKR